jgi:hypothetical protein
MGTEISTDESWRLSVAFNDAFTNIMRPDNEAKVVGRSVDARKANIHHSRVIF